MKKYRWGILGLGSIANRFMSGHTLVDRAELYAVASRDGGKARAFAQKYHAVKAYDSYEAMVSDPEVDIVYIATPHPFHLAHASLALKAGKHVLVEKPACVNERELAALCALAQQKGLFLMEAMWTRFFPVNRQVIRWLTEGRIGRLGQVQAAFAYASAVGDGKSRVYNPELAGGALLDVGVYPIAYADMCYDAAPEAVAALADKAVTGVDALSNYLLRYPGGGMALLSSAVSCYQKDTAYLWGEKGSIEVPNFWHPSRAVLTVNGRHEVFESPVVNEGFQYEIEHVHSCLDQGLTQSPIMPHATSQRIMAVCDEIRRQIDLVYPFEQEIHHEHY